MVLTKATEYALKSIVYMAKHPDQEYFGVREMSESLDVSSSYLAKILQKLVRDGFVKSITGPGGGFGLNKKPERIHMMDILESMEDREFLEKCILGWAECGDENPCPFHTKWETFRKELKGHLLSTSVEDVSNLFWPRYNRDYRPGKNAARSAKKKGGTPRSRNSSGSR